MENSNKTNITHTSAELMQILDFYLDIEEVSEQPYLVLDGVRIIL